MLRGDFGTSIAARQPVLGLVLGRLPATLELSLVALVIAVATGVAVALWGTRLRDTRARWAWRPPRPSPSLTSREGSS